MNLSPHFTLEEAVLSDTAVRHGIDNTPTEGTVENMKIAALGMEEVRVLLGGGPLQVTSWYRCDELNRILPGSRKPEGHVSGYCVDFVDWTRTPREVISAILNGGIIDFDQLILEGTWTHISFHPLMRRSVLTAHFGAGETTYTSGI